MPGGQGPSPGTGAACGAAPPRGVAGGVEGTGMSAGWRGWGAPRPCVEAAARWALEEASRRAPRGVRTARGNHPRPCWWREVAAPCARLARAGAALEGSSVPGASLVWRVRPAGWERSRSGERARDSRWRCRCCAEPAG
eukprot:12204360-Alexandrium_andersonii.AAC.1